MRLKEYSTGWLEKPRGPVEAAFAIGAVTMFIGVCISGRIGTLVELGTLEWLTNEVFFLLCVGSTAIFIMLIMRCIDRDDLDDLKNRVSKLEEEEENGED